MVRTNRGGARDWALVMSELCALPVTLAWESGAWVMTWTDGPTRTMMRRRLTALSDTRVGAPLLAEQILLSRQSSPLAWALAWLAEGSPPADQNVAEIVGIIEARRDQIAYPPAQDPAMVAAARLLAAVARDDEHQMGALLREAAPHARQQQRRFRSTSPARWPLGGPPPALLGLPEAQSPAAQPHEGNDTRECARCGTPLPPTANAHAPRTTNDASVTGSPSAVRSVQGDRRRFARAG